LEAAQDLFVSVTLLRDDVQKWQQVERVESADNQDSHARREDQREIVVRHVWRLLPRGYRNTAYGGSERVGMCVAAEFGGLDLQVC